MLIILFIIQLILLGVGIYLIYTVPCIKRDDFRGGRGGRGGRIRIFPFSRGKSNKNCMKFSEYSKTNVFRS